MQFLRPDSTDTAVDHRIRILPCSVESSIPDISNPKDDQTIVRDGVEACVGRQVAGECFELMDFPFAYSHEVPFPLKGIDEEVATEAFL